MGMLKRMKDMRDMVEAAPGMVAQAQQFSAQAQQFSAQAQQMAAAQQAAYQAQAGQAVGAQPGGFAEGADFDPIACVSIEQFVSVSKGVAAFVLPDGLPPYPATTQQCVSQMQIGKLQPGLTLQASVDPSNPAAIWLDLESVR
jgi:hypothetical protein